jgi:hypothetical protein
MITKDELLLLSEKQSKAYQELERWGLRNTIGCRSAAEYAEINVEYRLAEQRWLAASAAYNAAIEQFVEEAS